MRPGGSFGNRRSANPIRGDAESRIIRFARRSQEILKLLLEGFRNEEWKEEMRRLDERKAELEAALTTASTDSPQPALHPQMAKVFSEKAAQLAAALEHDEERDAARLALRGFLQKIVIPSGDGLLQVVGNLGEMLTAARGRNGSRPLVAGLPVG